MGIHSPWVVFCYLGWTGQLLFVALLTLNLWR